MMQALLSDGGYLSLRDQVFRAVLESADPFAHAASLAEKKEDHARVLDLLGTVCSDLIQIIGKGGSVQFREQTSELSAFAERLGPQRLHALLDGYLDLRRKAQTNCSLQLALEQFFLTPL